MPFIDPIHKIVFDYDKSGRGYLKIMKNDDDHAFVSARTGSVCFDGKLKNAIQPITWYIRSGLEVPANEERDLMLILGLEGKPWKIRLWPKPEHEEGDAISHILIHPDGSFNNLHDGNGTGGCIGTLTNAMHFYRFFEAYDFTKAILKVEVSIV